MATTDATTAAAVLRRVEEEHGRVRRDASARAFQIFRWRTNGDAQVLRHPPRDAAATPPST